MIGTSLARAAFMDDSTHGTNKKARGCAVEPPKLSGLLCLWIILARNLSLYTSMRNERRLREVGKLAAVSFSLVCTVFIVGCLLQARERRNARS